MEMNGPLQRSFEQLRVPPLDDERELPFLPVPSFDEFTCISPISAAPLMARNDGDTIINLDTRTKTYILFEIRQNYSASLFARCRRQRPLHLPSPVLPASRAVGGRVA
eukprot:1630024-Pleurochrysis_carterae.AAC.4